MNWIFDDGGRADAGFKGRTCDCATRAITIATGRSYRDVYDDLFARTLADRPTMAKLELQYGHRARTHASPRDGMPKRISSGYLDEHGWTWTPTMLIGSGCRVHLKADELPAGRIICKVSKHLVAVIDGVIHDTHDCSRGGTRCVYGYYQLKEAS